MLLLERLQKLFVDVVAHFVDMVAHLIFYYRKSAIQHRRANAHE